jgi:hypothetical protein
MDGRRGRLLTAPDRGPENEPRLEEETMRWTKALGLVALAAVSAAPHAAAQAPLAPRPKGTPTPPPTVPGYVATVEIKALAPGLKTHLEARIHLAEDLSRVEVVSPDFLLPAGAFLLHQAGERFYAIADPRAKTYFVMDSGALLDALEGSAGIVNSRYVASVQNTDEKKTIAGYPCRKSVVTVTYASSVPFENDRILVKGNNDIEVWHTSELVSAAAMDHLFFKFQRDKTGEVQKALAPRIGFPMEVRFVVTHGEGTRQAAVQPGSFEMKVTELKKAKDLDSELFRIPPAGYTQTGKSPIKAAAAGVAP